MWSFIDRNYSLELERDDNNFILRKYFNTNRIYLKYNVFKFVFLNRLYLFASPHTITLLHHYSFSHYLISKLCTFPNINPGRFLVRDLSRFIPSLGHSVISCTTTWSINAIYFYYLVSTSPISMFSYEFLSNHPNLPIITPGQYRHHLAHIQS